MSELPPCGIYVTTAALGGIPEGRLVYFHNHGDPGPGLYLPARWKGNRRFEAETLVQLGYNGSGAAILFLPEWVDGQLAIPDRGTHIERERVASLTPLKVAMTEPQVHEEGADGRLLH